MAKNKQVKQNKANEKYKILVMMKTFIHCFQALNCESGIYLAISAPVKCMYKNDSPILFLIIYSKAAI